MASADDAWALYTDETGAPYWFNSVSGETQWADASHATSHAQDWTAHGDAGAAAEAPASSGALYTASDAVISDGPWEEAFTDAGDRYYYNPNTGQSVWELPSHLIVPPQAATLPPPSDIRRTVSGLSVSRMRPRSHAILEEHTPTRATSARAARRQRRARSAAPHVLPPPVGVKASLLMPLPQASDGGTDTDGGASGSPAVSTATPWGLTSKESLRHRSEMVLQAARARRYRREQARNGHAVDYRADLERGGGASSPSSPSGASGSDDDSEEERTLMAPDGGLAIGPLIWRRASTVVNSAGRAIGVVVSAVRSVARKATPYVDRFINRAATTTTSVIAVVEAGATAPAVPLHTAGKPKEQPPVPPPGAPLPSPSGPAASPSKASPSAAVPAPVLAVPRRTPRPPAAAPPPLPPPAAVAAASSAAFAAPASASASVPASAQEVQADASTVESAESSTAGDMDMPLPLKLSAAAAAAAATPGKQAPVGDGAATSTMPPGSSPGAVVAE